MPKLSLSKARHARPLDYCSLLLPTLPLEAGFDPLIPITPAISNPVSLFAIPILHSSHLTSLRLSTIIPTRPRGIAVDVDKGSWHGG